MSATVSARSRPAEYAPLPNWPNEFPPHAHTVPDGSSNNEWYPPPASTPANEDEAGHCQDVKRFRIATVATLATVSTLVTVVYCGTLTILVNVTTFVTVSTTRFVTTQ